MIEHENISEDRVCVYAIQSILNMEGSWSEDEMNQHIDTYINMYDINSNSSAGFTPLFYATSLNDLRVVQVLLNKGADPDVKNIHGHSPLFIASSKGNTELVKELVSNGANVDLQDQSGKTPLMFAAANGHVEAAKYLIDQSKNINIADNQGNTALHYAFKAVKRDIIEHLINNNADMSIENKNGISGNLIKNTIINSYNKVKNQQQAPKVAEQNLSESAPKKKKESTKFRDAVMKSRQNDSNKHRSR